MLVVVAVQLVLPTGNSTPTVEVRGGEGGRDTELSVERIEILDLLLGVTDGREGGRARNARMRKAERSAHDDTRR